MLADVRIANACDELRVLVHALVSESRLQLVLGEQIRMYFWGSDIEIRVYGALLQSVWVVMSSGGI